MHCCCYCMYHYTDCVGERLEALPLNPLEDLQLCMRSSDKKCLWYRSLVLDTTLSFLLSRSSNVTPYLNLRRLTFNVKVRRDIRNLGMAIHRAQTSSFTCCSIAMPWLACPSVALKNKDRVNRIPLNLEHLLPTYKQLSRLPRQNALYKIK